MNPLSRRSVIAGSAAVVTAIPAVGLCRVAEDASELRALVDAHRVADAAFSIQVDRFLNLVSFEYDEKWEAANDAMQDAFQALCDHSCSSIEEVRLKASYLLTTWMVKDAWDEDAKAFLELFVTPAG